MISSRLSARALAAAMLLAAPLCADDPPASRHLPPQPWLVLELRDAPNALRAIEAHTGWRSLWESAIVLSPDGGAGLVKLLPVLRALESASGTTPLAALGDLLGPRALTWIEGPDEWLLEIAPRDPRAVARTLLALDRSLAAVLGAPRLAEFTCEGAPGWSIGAGFHIVRAHESFLVGPRRELVERALRRGRAAARASSAADALPPSFGSGATLWLDGDILRRSEGVAALPEKLREPIANLLFGSYLEPLLTARPLQVELSWNVDLSKLRAEAVAGDARGLDAYARALCAPAAPQVAVPSFASADGFLGRLRLQRDWARWWREKDARWSEAGRAGIRELEQLLSLLLKGEDFADALADLEGPLELLLVEPRFDGAAQPAHRYPAAALVIGLARAERGEVFERAFRTTIGISNGERVKSGFSTLDVSAGEESGFRVVRTKWDEGALELARVEGNLSPAFARCAHVVVIASSAQALDAALGVLRTVPHGGDGQPDHTSPVGDELALDGRSIARLLRANREALVFERALDEGEEFYIAERRIDALLALAEVFERAALRIELDAERVRAVLEIEFAQVNR